MPGLGIISGGSPIESVGDGCDNFTLTVESLTFVNTSSEAEKENLIMTYASNQEYFTVQPGGAIQKGIIKLMQIQLIL